MRKLIVLTGLLGWFVPAVFPVALAATVHHEVVVRLEPEAHRLLVEDRVSLPADASDGLILKLHAGLAPRVVSEGASLKLLEGPREDQGTIPLEVYRLDLDPGLRHFTLRYQGEIHHPVKQLGEDYGRSFPISPGIIGPDGVFLGAASHWFPQIQGLPMLGFRLTVDLPVAWRSVSQGARTERLESGGGVRETWEEASPQEEIYLVAAPFTEYRQEGGAAHAVVFLREPDRTLAQRYLELTGRYIAMYEELIGPYPYAKFALVENFWETGYGMPSFTLLGPRVIRLPFIPYTSYPHEILHNWWGNGVYVDFDSGNWSEGLTSYLADHLLKEQRGDGAGYRRATLQKYADYVHRNRDFPLRQFRGRHSAVSEAVGYGKTLMVFHMLRQHLGDETFVAGLRRLYEDHRFRTAGWTDVTAAFEAVYGRSLGDFFRQWVDRPGAPELRLGDTAVAESATGFSLRTTIRQTQDEAPFALRVPLAVKVADHEQAILTTVDMRGREQTAVIELPGRPLRLDVDPDFDLFRRLHREEIPPAISQALGGERILIVLPGAADESRRAAYRRLAEAWRRGRHVDLRIRRDDELDALPEDRAVWLFGWQNRFRPVLDEALSAYDFESRPASVDLNGGRLNRNDHSLVVLARNPANPDRALAWVAAHDPAVIPGLGRKLPHYGKYSYLAFEGEAPDNIVKGQWPVLASPLSVALAGSGVPAPAPRSPKPLAELPASFSAARMLEDVRRLADPQLEGRGLGGQGVDTAAAYIAEQFRKIGLVPAGDAGESYFQAWRARSGDPPRSMVLRNVIGLLPGDATAESANSVVVVGAHYDHLGLGWPDVRAGNQGRIHPGADDNASGVAVLLELARVLARSGRPDRSIVFVAFTGEEAGRLGSRHYVETALSGQDRRIIGMLNLDTVGRLGEGPLYVIGTDSAREWPYIFRGAGYVTGVPVESVSEPLDSSDQTSFIEAGVPAVQLFSGAHLDYHRPSDTVDRIDAVGMVRVAAVAREAVDYLAGRDGRLSAAGPPPASGPKGAHRTARSAALGTVPDFGYSGEGVRIAGVRPDSPAARSDIREGDVLVSLNGRRVATLTAYAEILRELEPGDSVTLGFRRDGEIRTVGMQAEKR